MLIDFNSTQTEVLPYLALPLCRVKTKDHEGTAILPAFGAFKTHGKRRRDKEAVAERRLATLRRPPEKNEQSQQQ